MLFIFNLTFRPSSFINFSSPIQCHFECFAERVQRINICDASFNRKMSLPRSGIRQVTGHVDRCRFTCRRCESVSDELPERNERTFGNDDRQEWSMEFDQKNT